MKPTQQSPDFPDAFYRVSVKGLCVREGKVLLVHDYGGSDVDMSSKWELPGGGVDFGEDFQSALRREVREEMGLAVAWMDDRPMHIWTTRYVHGRSMDWYWLCSVFFRFDVENLDFTPTEECREIRFFSKKELQENIAELGLQVVPLAERFNPEDFT